jgi:glycerophosphoryl diester phosphodiesterase
MNNKSLIIGHRGAKGHIAENTLESIQKALDFGVDGIEIDVHKCKSGELVVFHDLTLDRLTNAKGEISNYTLQELKKLKVEELYEIPTLQEVLDLVSGRCFMNIELKGEDTASTAVKIVEQYIENNNWTYAEFLLSSFQHHELEMVFHLNPKIPLAVLTKASMDQAIEFATQVKAMAIHPNIAIVSNENIARAKGLGFKVNVWTVNEVQAIKRMKSYKVDGIISDFPDRI